MNCSPDRHRVPVGINTIGCSAPAAMLVIQRLDRFVQFPKPSTLVSGIFFKSSVSSRGYGRLNRQVTG